MSYHSPSLLRLLGFGLLGSALFSTSFVLYELMSVQGGHWFWSASLRCLFMWLLLTAMIWLQHRGSFAVLVALGRLFVRHVGFWCLVGTIGLGTYGFLAFAADFAPAWVVTSTYLFTVVASLLVLALFGQRFSAKVVVCALVVFLGIVLANLGEGLKDGGLPTDLGRLLLFGALPALIAAFCFPMGNQLIWQAACKDKFSSDFAVNGFYQFLLKYLPKVDGDLLANPLHKVWLLSVGSLPAWFIFGFVIRPPMPSMSQINTTFLVALLAGVLGTSVFLFARGGARHANEVAMVDATQASEIIFALIGGMLLLGTPMPSVLSMVGVVMVVVGLILFARAS